MTDHRCIIIQMISAHHPVSENVALVIYSVIFFRSTGHGKEGHLLQFFADPVSRARINEEINTNCS